MSKNTIAEIHVRYTSQFLKCGIERVTQSRDAELVFREVWNDDTIQLQEEFKVMYLNRSNRIIGICNHSRGGISGTVVDNRLVLATGLKAAASGFILCHNHPSGNLKPSQNDIQLTKRLKLAGEHVEIQLMDHLILTHEGYYSFADNGGI